MPATKTLLGASIISALLGGKHIVGILSVWLAAVPTLLVSACFVLLMPLLAPKSLQEMYDRYES